MAGAPPTVTSGMLQSALADRIAWEYGRRLREAGLWPEESAEHGVLEVPSKEEVDLARRIFRELCDEEVLS